MLKKTNLKKTKVSDSTLDVSFSFQNYFIYFKHKHTLNVPCCATLNKAKPQHQQLGKLYFLLYLPKTSYVLSLC